MDDPARKTDFAQQSRGRSPGILREFGSFLLESKKWWLVPVLVALLLLGLLLIFGGTAVAPWVYTLF